ncbi:uncharacterized protein J3R85_015421 [Psidium guajava]|nr:uncharacterized protein J3R85_015421 [Psidium guajava]
MCYDLLLLFLRVGGGWNMETLRVHAVSCEFQGQSAQTHLISCWTKPKPTPPTSFPILPGKFVSFPSYLSLLEC